MLLQVYSRYNVVRYQILMTSLVSVKLNLQQLLCTSKYLGAIAAVHRVTIKKYKFVGKQLSSKIKNLFKKGTEESSGLQHPLCEKMVKSKQWNTAEL